MTTLERLKKAVERQRALHEEMILHEVEYEQLQEDSYELDKEVNLLKSKFLEESLGSSAGRAAD